MRGLKPRMGKKAMPAKVVLGPRAVAAVKATPPGSDATLGGPPAAAPDDADMAPMPAAGAAPPVGATDGLGAGGGGLAVHPSLKGFAIHGREPRHTSKTR